MLLEVVGGVNIFFRVEKTHDVSDGKKTCGNSYLQAACCTLML